MLSKTRRSRPRALAAILAALVAAIAISACGATNEIDNVGEGEAFNLGPLNYNVTFSRILNPNDTEDRNYLVGQPPPGPDEAYFGVWVQIHNGDHESGQRLPSSFRIKNTEGQTFDNLPSKSIFALQPGSVVGPNQNVPAPDSAAQSGPIGGSMILFKLEDEATERRPLVLEIPGEGGPATVELDF